MAAFSTVANITGNGSVFAVSESGARRLLKIGDELQKGETIQTVGDVRVELKMEDGQALAVAPNQSIRLDENVAETEGRPTAQNAALAQPAATANTVIDALNADGDLLENLDATAAGLGAGGGEGSGSSFVQLLRITEGTNPLSFTYGLNETSDVDLPRGFAVAQERALEEPVEEPSVEEPSVEEPSVEEPVVTITYEYYTEVTTSTAPGDTTYGPWTEVGRNTTTDTSTTPDEDNKQNVVTTTATTTVDLSRDVTTSEITTTTTTTYKVEVTTTRNPDGTVTVSNADPVVDNVETSTETTTTTTQETNQEVSTDTNVDYDPWPAEPVTVITTETETRVSTETTTQTNVGNEVETGRTSTTTVSEKLNDDETATIKTTTTTTTIEYNQATDTITTTVTTTETYVREVTTTTYPNGDVNVVNGDWTLSSTDIDTVSDTVTTNAPRTEVLTDTDVVEIPIEQDDTKDNNGHGNNTDGQDDDNPGQGTGGPNSQPKDGDDEDEGNQGNQGDPTPGVGQNDDPDNALPDLLPPDEEEEDSNPGNSGQNNGWGNGDQTAPGESGDNNNAENNTSGATNPSNSPNSGSLSISDLLTDNNPDEITYTEVAVGNSGKTTTDITVRDTVTDQSMDHSFNTHIDHTVQAILDALKQQGPGTD